MECPGRYRPTCQPSYCQQQQLFRTTLTTIRSLSTYPAKYNRMQHSWNEDHTKCNKMQQGILLHCAGMLFLLGLSKGVCFAKCNSIHISVVVIWLICRTMNSAKCNNMSLSWLPNTTKCNTNMKWVTWLLNATNSSKERHLNWLPNATDYNNCYHLVHIVASSIQRPAQKSLAYIHKFDVKELNTNLNVTFTCPWRWVSCCISDGQKQLSSIIAWYAATAFSVWPDCLQKWHKPTNRSTLIRAQKLQT